MSVKQKLIKPLIKKSYQIPKPRCKNTFLLLCVHNTKGPVRAQLYGTPQQRTPQVSASFRYCV